MWEGNQLIGDTAPENTLLNVPGGGDAVRFFAILEKDPPLQNGSFEVPALDDPADFTANNPNWVDGRYGDGGTTTPNTATGWSTTEIAANECGIWYPDEYTAPDGNNVGLATARDGYDQGLSQVLSLNLAANTQYDLSVKVANPSNFNGGTTADYRVELLAGGVVIASAAGTSPADNTTVVTASLSYGPEATPAQEGQALEVRLIAVDTLAADDSLEVEFDDVQLTVTTP